jgi:hypothetical protein
MSSSSGFLSDGTLAARERRTPANSTPTRLEDCAAQLVAAREVA